MLFEPRSLTAGRAFLHDAYRRAFRGADAVLLAPIFHHGRLGADERLDPEKLVRELRAEGVAAEAFGDLEALFAATIECARPGDVVATMSSGAFGGMPSRLLQALGAASGASDADA